MSNYLTIFSDYLMLFPLQGCDVMVASSRLVAVVQRFSQNAVLLSIRSKTHTLFSRYLLVTNTTVSFCLAGAGDLMNQRYEAFCGTRNQWSPLRTRNQCAQGLFFGPLFHFWYILLDHAMPGRTAVTVIRKVGVVYLFLAISSNKSKQSVFNTS